MKSASKIGLKASPTTIRVGTVQMEKHPNYMALINEAESKGFTVVQDKNAFIRHVQYINQSKKVIRVEKELHVIPGMRYIDLEHEIGHIRQLERFDWKLFTDRYMVKANGNIKEFNNSDDILHEWRDYVTEFHNRLQEFLKLYEREADLELLLEHSRESNKGVFYWMLFFKDKVTKTSHRKWVKQNFPDLKDLRIKYASAIDKLKKQYPDIHFD